MSSQAGRSERAYYDSFFRSPDAGALDDGVGFHSLRQIQAGYLRRKIQSLSTVRTIASVGCGNGEIEMLLCDSHWRVFAFDLSFIGPATGNQRAIRRQLTHLSFGQAGLTDLPLSGGSCDVVVAMSVLHHIGPDRRAQALSEIYRVLRAGGCFIAYDPSKWRAVRLAKFLVRFKYDALHSPDEEELSPREMQRLAVEVGFIQTQVEFFDFFIDPLTWLFPNMPPGVFHALWKLDRALTYMPGNQFASNFFLIGHKPLTRQAIAGCAQRK